MKNLKFVYYIIIVGLVVHLIGLAFKIMHWKYGDMLLLTGLAAYVLLGIMLTIKGVRQSREFKSLQVFNIILGLLIIIPTCIYSIPKILYHQAFIDSTLLFHFLIIFVVYSLFTNKNLWNQYTREEKVLVAYVFIRNVFTVMITLIFKYLV